MSPSTIQPADRELALLIVASDCRMMQPEPRDVVALIDFLEEEEGDGIHT